MPQGLLSALLELSSPCFLTLSLPSAFGGLDDDMSPYASDCNDVDDVDEERKEGRMVSKESCRIWRRAGQELNRHNPYSAIILLLFLPSPSLPLSPHLSRPICLSLSHT